MKIYFVLRLVVAGIIFSASLDAGQPASNSPEKVRSIAKARAAARAEVVPKQMGFDLSKYVILPVDRHEPEGVLSDSEIGPFLAPVALESDWWIVLFIPEQIGTVPPLCVYLDKKTDVIRGYLIGSVTSDAEEKKTAQPGATDNPGGA
jgi:hypothetical protein